MTDWREELVEQISKIDNVESAQAVLTTIARYTLDAADAPTRKNLAETRRLVQHAIVDKLLPAAQCSNCQAEIRKLWKEHCELFSKYVPAELWEVVRDRVENFWSFK